MAPDNRPPGLGLKSPSRVMGVGVGDAQLGDRSGRRFGPRLFAVADSGIVGCKMERVVLTATGFDTPLRYERVEGLRPEPGPSDVIVAVDACGVAHRDLIDRSGRMAFMALPIVQGHEFSGQIEAIGAQVSEWTIGDRVGALHRDHCGSCVACSEGETGHCQHGMRVFGITVDGGYASDVVAHESALYRLPNSMPAAHGAVFNSTFGTAFRAMNRFGGLEPGQHVLVTGANGGVGLAGVQVAKRQGASVVAVVRDPEAAEFVTALGADEVIVDGGTAFHKRLPGGQVDVVLDCVGSPTFNSSLRSLRLGGGLGLVGNVSTSRAEVNLGRIVAGDVRICGSSGATRKDLTALLGIHAAEPLTFQIADELPLAEADWAQRRLLEGGLRGRLVLRPG